MCKRLICLVSVVFLLSMAGQAWADLVAHWKFDEGTGTAAEDSAGNFHGILQGDPAWVQGVNRSALSFNGIDDAVLIGPDPEFNSPVSFSVALWANIRDYSDQWAECVIGVRDSGASWSLRRFGTWWGSQDPDTYPMPAEVLSFTTFGIPHEKALATGQLVVDSPSNTVPPLNEWLHIACIYDNENNKKYIYFNGVLDAEWDTMPGTGLTPSTESLYIGAMSTQGDAGPSDFFDGIIDDVRFYNHALNEEEVQEAMTGSKPGLASMPDPADWTTDVPRDVVLSWKPGQFAAPTNGHKVYLGESFDEVNDATDGVAQTAAGYAPAQRLDLGRTYYWRVDEVNAPPTSHIEFKGEVWSFTIEPLAYPVENITATASSAFLVENGPENTVNGSGLDVNDLHSTQEADMWMSGNEPNGAWIEFEFDKVYKLHEILVWNSNQTVEKMFGLGCRDVTIEYLADGNDYTTLGTTHEFAQAPGTSGYAHNTTIDFGGVTAKKVRLTISSNWKNLLTQYGLSEVRFTYTPVFAREPLPESGATDVDVDMDVTLSWRAGREAVEHNVYISTDVQAVIDSNVPVSTVAEASHGPLSLDLDQTYYWKVNEVNEAGTPAMLEGDIWNFTTLDSLVVDDFESYNDIDDLANPESNRIFEAWPDGYEDLANGALIGNDPANPSYAETAIVHGGDQSIPFFYSNTGAAAYSEAEHTFAVPRNWTASGIQTLVLYFHGSPGNTGQLYVKVNGFKVAYDGDAADITRPRWKQWNIDLPSLASLGVNLQEVRTLGIGIDGSGAAGTFYIDDIELYPSVSEVPSEDIWIEAEAADVIIEPMRVHDDTEASGGQYIAVLNGEGGGSGYPDPNGIATYTFDVAGGVYGIQFRVIAPSGSDDSFFLRFPDATDITPGTGTDGRITFNSIATGNAWHWDEVHSSEHSNEVVNVTLPAGTNTMEITYREDGALLDAILITSDVE